jgi:hypothetical protein
LAELLVVDAVVQALNADSAMTITVCDPDRRIAPLCRCGMKASNIGFV